MSHLPIEDLFDKVDSKYRLVIIAAKRSRQLNQGVRPLLQPKGYKTTYIALEELAAGKVEYTIKSFDEMTKTGVYAEAVKPTWFREITPEGVTTEEETEEEEQELEGVAPAEAEEESEAAPAEVGGQLVSLDEVEKAEEEKEEE